MGFLFERKRNFYFLIRNDVNGEYINVLGERYDIRELKYSNIRVNLEVCPKTSYKNLKEFVKEMSLKKFYK